MFKIRLKVGRILILIYLFQIVCAVEKNCFFFKYSKPRYL